MSLAAFVCAKTVNIKSEKFQFNISAIAINFAIILAFMIMTVIYIKIKENVLLNNVVDFKNPNFLLMLLFALLAAFPVIFLKASLTNFKEHIAELNWEKLGGKFFLIFYLATLLFSTISIMVAFFLYDCNYSYFPDFSRAIYSVIFCFTITVALSAFLSAAADFLGKHTKSISVLLLIIFLVVFISGSLIYFTSGVNGTSRNFSVCHYSDTDSDGYEIAFAEGEYMPDYDDDDEYTYQGLDENDKLSFLWNNPEDDDDNVKAAIKFGLKELDISADHTHFFNSYFMMGQYSRSDYENKKGGLAYYRIVKYIQKYRTQLSLMALSNAYWDQIIQNIPDKIYKKKKLNDLVYMLRWAYLDLYNEEYNDPYMHFYNVYNRMRMHEAYSLYEYYPHIRDYVNEEELPYPMKDSEGEINKNLTVWVYSFWGRRYNDGNAAEVYRILNKLYENYSGE